MITMGVCVGLGVLSLNAPVDKPPTPEQVRAIVKKLEQPTWDRVSGGHLKPEDGPPPAVDFAPISDDFQFSRVREQAIPLLVELFENRKKPGQARAQAVAALSDFLRGYEAGPDPRALAVLKAGLRDEDVSVRWMSCYASQWIGKHWNRRVLGRDLDNNGFRCPPPEKTALRPAEVKEILPLVVSCIKDMDPAVAATAIRAVVMLGEPGIGRDEVLAAVARKEPRVRIAAIQAMVEVAKDHPKSLPAILGRVKDEDETVRGAAATELAKAWPENQDAANAVIDLLKAPEHKIAFRQAVESVGAFGKRAGPAVGTLTQVLKDTHSKVSISEYNILYYGALTALKQIGPDAKPAARAVLDFTAEGAERRVIEVLREIDPDAMMIAQKRYQKIIDDFNKGYNRPPEPALPIPMP